MSDFAQKGVKDPIGIDMSKLESEVQIYPNPANEKINIRFPIDAVQKFEIALVSIQGQVLFLTETVVSKESELEIDITDFSTGLHFLQISMGESIFTKKLIIE